MTQSLAAAPAPAPASGTSVRAIMSPRGAGDTPGRMRLVSAALVVVSLLVGLVSAQAFWAADAALQRADENAAQLVRLQGIQTSLVRADASATNSFLVGGLEPPEQRAEYDAAIEQASRLITFAARAQPADGEALAALTAAVGDYTGGVVQARTINRQGLPLGAQFLRDASASLRTDALALLGALTAANEDRAEAEFTAARQARALAIGAGLVGLVLVAAGLVWLAQRTHRYLNVPVLGAGIVVLLLLVASALTLGAVGSSVTRVQDGSYATARSMAGARIAAFDAKANESLTLISRGSGAAFEESWVTSAATTTSTLEEVAVDLVPGWTAYTDLHAQIRALDDGGAWEQAVAAATTRAEGSANAAFDAFDAASDERLTLAGDDTSAALKDARSGLTLGAWLSVLAGLLAAALAWWGISQRIEEYR